MTVVTTTDTYRTRPNTSFGVDISSIQTSVDFASLKNDGVKWAMLRAYGSAHSGNGDAMFEKFIQQANAVGMPTGAYYYSIPTMNTADAKTQADQFITKVKNGYGGGFGQLTPIVDVEDNSNIVASGTLSTLQIPTTDLLNWVDYFRNYFEDKTGVQLGLYTAKDFIETKDNFNEGKTQQGNILKDMPLWVAAYIQYGYTNAPLAGGWTNYIAWQYDYRNKFAGVPSGQGVDTSIAPIPFNFNQKRVVYTQELTVANTVTNADSHTVDNGDTVVTTSTTVTTTTMKRSTVKSYQ